MTVFSCHPEEDPPKRVLENELKLLGFSAVAAFRQADETVYVGLHARVSGFAQFTFGVAEDGLD
ncbi:hypothetical protein [Serpens gallinarum]|nr:hypothetical protein [Serpens gallinarum]